MTVPPRGPRIAPQDYRTATKMWQRLKSGALEEATQALSSALSEFFSDAGVLRPGALPTLAGDLTGVLTANVLSKLHGILIDVTPPADHGALTYDQATDTFKFLTVGSSLVQDEGVDIALRAKINFIGTIVTAVDDAINGRVNVTVTNPVPPHEAASDPHPQYTTATELATALLAYITKALIDAKGDLIVGQANDTPVRLGVGADDTSLIADSTQPQGLRWGVPVRTTMHWEPVTNGDADSPELVFDDGDVVMEEVLT
jgi:hypothetical protein